MTTYISLSDRWQTVLWVHTYWRWKRPIHLFRPSTTNRRLYLSIHFLNGTLCRTESNIILYLHIEKKIWPVRKHYASSFVTVHFPMGLITGYNNMVLHLLRVDTCFRAWLDSSLRVRLVPKDVLILLFPILIRSLLRYTDNVLICRLLFLHKS